MVSTVDDMLRWLRHLATPAVGNPESTALLSAPHKLPHGGDTGYGFGLLSCTHRRIPMISHSGGGLGSNAQMIRVPGADLDLVVLVNRSDVSATELAGRILNVCFGGEDRLPSREKDSVTGVFRSSATGRVIELRVENGRSMALINGAEDWPLALGGEQMLCPPREHCASLSLKLCGSRQRLESLQCEYFGTGDQYLPVPSGPPVASDSVAGDYQSDSVGVRMKVHAGGQTGRVTMIGRFGTKTYALESRGSRLWRLRSLDATPWGGMLWVESDGETVTVSTPQNWQIHFRRLP